MIIRNIGNKIVNVGTTVLMPDAEMKVNDVIGNAPAVKALVAKGHLLVVEEVPKETPAKKPRDMRVKKAAEAPAEVEAPAETAEPEETV